MLQYHRKNFDHLVKENQELQGIVNKLTAMLVIAQQEDSNGTNSRTERAGSPKSTGKAGASKAAGGTRNKKEV